MIYTCANRSELDGWLFPTVFSRRIPKPREFYLFPAYSKQRFLSRNNSVSRYIGIYENVQGRSQTRYNGDSIVRAHRERSKSEVRGNFVPALTSFEQVYRSLPFVCARFELCTFFAICGWHGFSQCFTVLHSYIVSHRSQMHATAFNFKTCEIYIFFSSAASFKSPTLARDDINCFIYALQRL